MQSNLFDEIKSWEETEIKNLTNDNEEMREFFDQLAIPVIRKAVRKIASQLRRFPREACQFGDDSKLNFFEEVCVMYQESSMDYYMLVEDTIHSCCESAYNDLSNEEKFIINHMTDSPCRDGTEIIKEAFSDYATNYENQKIIDALDFRSDID